MKLTTHLQLMLRSRKYGSIYTIPHTPSWHNAQLVKHKDNFTFTEGGRKEGIELGIGILGESEIQNLLMELDEK
jgi:hypothetical protein